MALLTRSWRTGFEVSKFRLFRNSVVSLSNKMNDDATKKQASLVDTEAVGHVFLIGINRPEKRNCVNEATARQLHQAFKVFESDEELRVAVLYGKGGNFCAGYDLGALSDLDFDEIKPLQEASESGRGPMGPTRMLFSKPVIAAVSGYAVAGGLELACMCDLRVAEESAIFGVFCRRFGVPLIDGGTVRLPRLIGLSRALDMMLTGRPVSAKEAHEMGLANRVVPVGSALGEATKIAQTLSAFPQECMRRDRLSAYHSCFSSPSLEEAFKFEWENAAHVIGSESIKGATRFVQGVGRKGSFEPTTNSKSKL